MLTVYVYQKCSTCRDALKWLDDHGIAHQVKAIRETPPTPAELKTALSMPAAAICGSSSTPPAWTTARSA